MPFDAYLAERIREVADRHGNITERKLFGGLGFFFCGNMCAGVWKESMIVRVGPDAYDDAMAQDFASTFDTSGRPMKGWVMVSPEGLESLSELETWLERGVRFAMTLPEK